MFDSIVHSLNKIADIVSQTLSAPAQQPPQYRIMRVKFEQIENGNFAASFDGPDAPAQARIVESMLHAAGAWDAKKSVDEKNPLARTVNFSMPEHQERFVARFQHLATELEKQMPTLMKVGAASQYLDADRTGWRKWLKVKHGSKLTVRVKMDDDEIGFATSVRTNEPRLIKLLNEAGFKERYNDGFRRSSLDKVEKGSKFRAKPEELDKLLEVLHSFGAPDVPRPNPPQRGGMIR